MTSDDPLPPYGDRHRYVAPQQQRYSHPPQRRHAGGVGYQRVQPPPQRPIRTGRRRRRRRRRRPIIAWMTAAVVAVFAVILVATALRSPNKQASTGAGASSRSSPASRARSRSAGAGAPQKSPPSSWPDLGVGQTFDLSENGSPAGTVTITSMTNSTMPSCYSCQAPHYGYYVFATVTITSKINGLDVVADDFSAIVNSEHFHYGDGNAFEAGYGEPTDLTTALNAGQTEKGQLLFDLPSQHGQVVYAQSPGGAPLAEWSF